MSDKITLDRETFKVLAADTRIDMLKKLDKHKKTLTDLSQEMGMSPSTVKEHLDKLVSAGLIEQIDRGTKWKYYRLTFKGQSIINPVETKVWILLGTSVLLLAASMLSFQAHLSELTTPVPALMAYAPEKSESTVAAPSGGGQPETLLATAASAGNAEPPTQEARMKQDYSEARAAGAEKLREAEVPAAEEHDSEESVWDEKSENKIAGEAAQPQATPPIPYLQMAAVVLFTFTSGACAGYLLKKRAVISD